MKYKEVNNLDDIAVGDRVVIEYGAGATGSKRTATVTRLTKTQVIIIDDKYGRNEERFLKRTGHIVGRERGRFAWVHAIRIIGIVVKESEK